MAQELKTIKIPEPLYRAIKSYMHKHELDSMGAAIDHAIGQAYLLEGVVKPQEQQKLIPQQPPLPPITPMTLDKQLLPIPPKGGPCSTCRYGKPWTPDPADGAPRVKCVSARATARNRVIRGIDQVRTEGCYQEGTYKAPY